MPIYNRLITSPPPFAEELISLDDNLICRWHSTIPSYFADDDHFPVDARYALGHGINMWRWRNLRIIMYRKYLVRWAHDHAAARDGNYTWHERVAVDRCLNAARETVESATYSWSINLHNRLAAWYVL